MMLLPSYFTFVAQASWAAIGRPLYSLYDMRALKASVKPRYATILAASCPTLWLIPSAQRGYRRAADRQAYIRRDDGLYISDGQPFPSPFHDDAYADDGFFSTYTCAIIEQCHYFSCQVIYRLDADKYFYYHRLIEIYG